MSETNNQSKSKTDAGVQPTGSPAQPVYKSWWFWAGIVVLAGGFVLYVRTWTRATHLDFTPETNPPPPVAAPAQH